MKRFTLLLGSLLFLVSVALPGMAKKETVAPPIIEVKTSPQDAEVFCDGVSRGSAPVQIADIQPGKHLIVVRKTGYDEQRRTVNIANGKRHALEFDLAQTTGLLIVNSQPKGATIKLDGLDRGKAPRLLTNIALGTHRISASLPGYQDKIIGVTLPDRIPQCVKIDMTSDAAKLILRSQPTGAHIVLNGISKGSTPKEIERVPSGETTIEMSMDGFEPFKRTVTLSAGQEERMTIALKPIPSTLTIVSDPTGARIYVDNEFKGTAPVTLKNLEPGAYQIRAELKTYDPKRRTVNLGHAQQSTEEFRFQHVVGSLQIITAPPGATVTINGENKGQTKPQDGPESLISAPFLLKDLPVGNYQVVITKKHHSTATFPVTIAKDDFVVKKVQLKRQFVPDTELTTTAGTYKCVFIRKEIDGSIVVEIKPGIFKTIAKEDIRVQRPID